MANLQFNLLSTINGVSGKLDGSKIVKSVADAIIEPTKQYLFSMTGRAAPGGPKKVAFNGYTEIIALIFAVCRRAAKNYSMNECNKDLTYKIFKHGNLKRKQYGNLKKKTHKNSDNMMINL